MHGVSELNAKSAVCTNQTPEKTFETLHARGWLPCSKVLVEHCKSTYAKPQKKRKAAVAAPTMGLDTTAVAMSEKAKRVKIMTEVVGAYRKLEPAQKRLWSFGKFFGYVLVQNPRFGTAFRPFIRQVIMLGGIQTQSTTCTFVVRFMYTNTQYILRQSFTST
jgi:hypothetical protein